MGKFIVLEGIDGSGKSTQAALLVDHLNALGYKAVLTCEPTKGVIGSTIRKAFAEEIKLEEKTIAMLFAADRYEHIHNQQDGMLQLLDDDYIVVSDRYILSSYAYQGVFAPYEWLKSLNSTNQEALWPDITLFIDLKPEDAMLRIQQNRTHIEVYETEENLKKVYNNYINAIADLPLQQQQQVKTIAGNKSISEISKDIIAIVQQAL